MSILSENTNFRENLHLRNGFFTILAPGETMSKLGVCKLMQATSCPHTEITPDVFTAAEVQLLHGARTGLEPL